MEVISMNIAVRYFTRSGNTKKLADAIADTVHVKAMPLTEKITEQTDLLFLGGSVYAGGIAPALADFINTLNSNLVKKVIIFSTAAVVKSAYPQIKSLLGEKGIIAAEQEYHCRGKFLCLHMNRPNKKDCAAAAEFAKSFIE
jgi:flavodoxin